MLFHLLIEKTVNFPPELLFSFFSFIKTSRDENKLWPIRRSTLRIQLWGIGL